jgi:hypothetical protein
MDFMQPLPVYGSGSGEMRPLPVPYTGGEMMMYPTGAPILATDPVPGMSATVMPYSTVTTDSGFGSLRKITDLAKQILGTAQVDVRFGGGEPTSGRVTLGEDRVMSGTTLALALVGGALLGAVLFGGRR